MTATVLPHRLLGSAGLAVPVLGLGCSSFGTTVDADGAARIVHASVDSGIHLFDTAPAYADGLGEELLGRALRKHSDRVLISTKFGARRRADAGRPTASSGQIRTEIDASLRRLGTDHVDLYHLHAPDPMTPWAEILGTLDELTVAGKVRFACCCNVSADQITAATGVAADHGSRGFVSVQNEYNLLRRKAETDSLPACSALGLGFLAYFPLAGGLLAGEYTATPTASSTVARTANRRHLSTDTLADLRALRNVAAARLGRSLLEVAIAAVLAQPGVTGALVGATTVRHVHENAAAARWQPTAADLDELAGLLAWDRTPG